MHKNVGYILNETIRRHPTFFTNFQHIIGNDSIIYFIEIIDEDHIRLKKDLQISMTPELIADLKSNFQVVD